MSHRKRVQPRRRPGTFITCDGLSWKGALRTVKAATDKPDVNVTGLAVRNVRDADDGGRSVTRPNR